MKVFVAGATGVLGWRAVRGLVAAGHDVTGVARSPEKARLLEPLGARPVEVDLFDAAAVEDAVAGHDAVCNLATHIPPLWRAGLPGSFAENDRIRTEASRNLVDAALATGARRFVQESITFGYADAGQDWIDEDATAEPASVVRTALEAESQAARVTADGGAGVVLRFGMFYGPDSSHSQETAGMIRRRLSPTLGRHDGYVSMIHLDDAAGAVVAALDAPPGTYNVVDDSPVTRRELGQAIASALGVRSPRSLPAVAARLGGAKASVLARSQRVSNKRFKAATGWVPGFPSVREGWRAVAQEMGGDVQVDRRRTVVRALLAVLGLVAVQIGVWAQFFPRSWYDDFPGGGRAWVSADGPFNEHLVRDVGGLYLALALFTVVALVRCTPALVRTAAVAWLVVGVPHLVYHASHLDLYDTSDQVANMASLGLGVVAPLALLWLAAPRHHVRTGGGG